MIRLSEEIVHFFKAQGFVVITTVDASGFPSSSCKGIIEINSRGKVYLLDLYKAKTYLNLKINPHMCLTAVDEHRFKGYCLKGRAQVVDRADIPSRILKLWDDRITSRLTQRLLKNLREEKGHPKHPEIMLPDPTYLIAVTIEEVTDLTPHNIRQ